MQVDPYILLEPASDSPVVVEVPHAGLWIDPESAATMVVSTSSVARDADLYVDELFADSPACGAALLSTRVSRYVVDLNRAEDDFDGEAVAGGAPRQRPRGVIWRRTSDGQPVVARPISRSEYERRCDTFYRPYHRALATLLQERRARFGFALLLCAHSMPAPKSRGGHNSAETVADVVPGTRGRTTAAAHWIDLVERLCRTRGWNIQHDVPYRGGHTTRRHGHPSEGVHVVQLELARRLYMDEASLARRPDGFAAVKRFARELVQALVSEAQQRSGTQKRRPRPSARPS